MSRSHEDLIKPTRIHFFYAQNWPIRLWFYLVVSVTLVIILNVTSIDLGNWQSMLRLVCIFSLATIIGLLIAFLFSWLFISPLYINRLRKNGGPFQVGDVVEILARPYRGQIAKVYALAPGNSVRLELGQKAKQDSSDVFAGTMLLLRSKPDQGKS